MNAHADVKRAAEAVLAMHQRASQSGGCMCGEVRLGESHVTHLADVLSGAGLLFRWPPQREVEA